MPVQFIKTSAGFINLGAIDAYVVEESRISIYLTGHSKPAFLLIGEEANRFLAFMRPYQVADITATVHHLPIKKA